jgi:DNA-binding MarR family transcriptional regulator
MDRTTLTAALKPLERRGLLIIAPDPKDGRARVLSLTDAGRTVLAQAVPIWTREHGKLDEELGGGSEALRASLKAIA